MSTRDGLTWIWLYGFKNIVLHDMANSDNNIASQNEIVLGENEMVCSLTNRVVKATDKEMTLQSMIAMMTEEYGFAPEDMERDYKVKYDDAESGKTKTQKVDLAIFNAGNAHDADELIRFIIVAKNAKVKSNDKKNGVEATTENILCTTDCEFACWTNGEDLQYVHAFEDAFGQVTCEAISDFPAEGQTLEDLEAQGERAIPRKPANESLVKTFKRCHDYIYGNEGMKKTAFWELLNLIFCKLYDEKRRFSDAREGISYRLYTWLNSDYGFRFIRNCQAGTKLCHPIPKMFLEIPVPIISEESMNKIDKAVKDAYTKRYDANNCERKAIRIIEQEIEKWNKH